MDLIEKEIRRIANSVVDERKKLFAENRWAKWNDAEDSTLLSDVEKFVNFQAYTHNRTKEGIRERIRKYL